MTDESTHASKPASGRLQSIVPQFTVPDVVRTAEYYRDVWGFRIAGYWQDPPVFAIVERDGIELFFNQASPDTAPRTGRVPGGYDVYLRVHGLDALAADLEERGAVILEGPVLREYGMRELVVRDCNDLIIALGETVVDGATAQEDYSDADGVMEQHCEREWPDDFSMRAYCLEQQRDAVAKLREGRPEDIPEEIFRQIRRQCASEWPDDNTMRVYCEEEQVAAFRRIRRRS
jgi:catechol 2,3-dioxygenase-like lactoylglutathione lyase family enzyme/Fe-S cluster biosynthesis and repair protein YggX